MSDIEIAQQATMQNITDIATQKLGLQVDDLDSYGRYKAKVSLQVMDDLATKPDGKLI
ncbi:MAG TPA: formate--tetrahydrofolate ligase, partial [Methylophaga sp.]|nr:formate--tetrahydrofolate ligase [Methylophaga sp.]